jgi:hypothetical protein
MKTKTFRAPDGAEWQVHVRLPGASNAMVVFQLVRGRGPQSDRYAWHLSHGPEARDVTARLDAGRVLQSLGDDDLGLLFRRSMSVGGPAPLPASEPGGPM